MARLNPCPSFIHPTRKKAPINSSNLILFAHAPSKAINNLHCQKTSSSANLDSFAGTLILQCRPSAGGAAHRQPHRVPRLRRSTILDNCHPALPGWADVWFRPYGPVSVMRFCFRVLTHAL